MSVKPILVKLAIALSVLVLTACAQAAPAVTYVRLTDGVVAPADHPSAPAKPVLTVTGRITATNTADGLALDVPSIERMGLIRYRVRDPWLEQDLEFSGVLVTDFLKAVGADPEAKTLHITALDDYEVEISIADAKRWPIMLATQTGGLPMSVEDKGPTRIVFPADPTIDALTYKDLWIWQLKMIDVR